MIRVVKIVLDLRAQIVIFAVLDSKMRLELALHVLIFLGLQQRLMGLVNQFAEMELSLVLKFAMMGILKMSKDVKKIAVES